MKRAISVLLGLGLVAAVAYAGDEKTGELKDPLEILKKVDAAAKAVQAVKYDVTFEGTGEIRKRTASVEGTYIMTGWTERGPEKFRVDARIRRRSGRQKMTAGTDGKTFFFIDHAARKAWKGDNEKSLGWSRRDWLAAVMGEFLHPEPFTDEINGKKRELKGSKEIGGEDCYEIQVVYDTPGDQENKATWFFSKKDFLPRARHDEFSLRSGKEAAYVKTITNLVVDPEIDENTFKFEMPEGYQAGEGRAP